MHGFYVSNGGLCNCSLGDVRLMAFAGVAVVWTMNNCRELITQIHRNVALETNPISGHWKAAVETLPF